MHSEKARGPTNPSDMVRVEDALQNRWEMPACIPDRTLLRPHKVTEPGLARQIRALVLNILSSIILSKKMYGLPQPRKESQTPHLVEFHEPSPPPPACPTPPALKLILPGAGGKACKNLAISWCDN